MNHHKELPLFCESLFKYSRNITKEVPVGVINIGGYNPIRIQSMTTTNTLDIDATAEQCASVFDVGAELMRITTQGKREASALEEIVKNIKKRGYSNPIVADVHFNPSAAHESARWVDKVRINPGNFADGAKKFEALNYSDLEYEQELLSVEKKLRPFIEICKDYNRAIRIGVNHGSLSDRIMSKYGDTAEGMVASCMEYIDICRKYDFHKIVLSIKSSNTRVMVHTVRLLVSTMKNSGFSYPLHLGVTEAGSGEDGRVKSAVGIGALLADGIGDTIRVSLTEDPEAEIPVASILTNHVKSLGGEQEIETVDIGNYSPYSYMERESHEVAFVGGKKVAPVVIDFRYCQVGISSTKPEAVIMQDAKQMLPKGWDDVVKIVPWNDGFVENSGFIPLYKMADIDKCNCEQISVIELEYKDLDNKMIEFLSSNKNLIMLLKSSNSHVMAEMRAFFLKMSNNKLTHPVILSKNYIEGQDEELQIISSFDLGGVFLDGYGDGLSLSFENKPLDFVLSTSFGILQASRVRFSKTEFISCPGCGRTLFDLQTTTKEVQQRTSHLKGVKIAIMGCIVNGLGEMADADYGYVGAAAGKISLYKNRELVEKNIPASEAVERLVDIIKENGDWVDA